MVHQMASDSTIFANHKDFGGDFGKEFAKNIDLCESLEIASGYFGATLIDTLKPKLIQVAKRGHCKILIGMIFNEGVSATQKEKLESLDEELKKINDKSGVFITLNQYHGKIYKFKNSSCEKIYVGSSNFSSSGFAVNYEFNTLITDLDTQVQVSQFLDFLWSPECDFSAPLKEVELFIKRSKAVVAAGVVGTSLKSLEIKSSSYPLIPFVSEVKIALRVDSQPNSSLNLFFDKGRKNKDGKYAPRPWYEVEITTTVAERGQDDYPVGEFDAYVNDGKKCYLIPMITASDNYKAITSKGDRTILGELIKGKLEDKGYLSKGERITSEILNEYGKDCVILKKFDVRKYYLEF